MPHRPGAAGSVASLGVGGGRRRLAGMSPQIATNTPVDRAGMLEFTRHRHRAILITTGEHPDWDGYRAAMRRQGKSLIRLTPRRWGPIATGGFPARLGP
jgi:hypothetical protein